MKKHLPDIRDMLGYIIRMALANFGGAAAMILFRLIPGNVPYGSARAVILIFSLSFVSLAAVLLITGLFWRRDIAADFVKDLSRTDVWKRAAFLILPGELLRLILTSLPLPPSGFTGYRFFGGAFNMTAAFLHDVLYLMPNGRRAEVLYHGYSAADNTTYLLCNTAVFLLQFALLVLLYERLYRKEAEKRAKELRLTMDPVGTTQHQLVIQRDYYYEHSITWEDRLGYAGFTVFAHIAVYLFTTLVVSHLLELWYGMATYVLLNVLITVPTVFILPLVLMKFHFKSTVPKLYSLADDPALWKKKAASFLLFGEAVRFLIGLLPTAVTQYGTVTSPVTMMLYEIFYLTPAGRFEAAAVNGQASFADLLVFFGIYLVYFAVYGWILLRMFKKRHGLHIRYLTGAMNEYDKEQRYRPKTVSRKAEKEDGEV